MLLVQAAAFKLLDFPQFHNNMITQRNLKYLKKAVDDGKWLCFHPYTWDKTLKRPVVTTSKRRLWGWYFCFAYTALYCLFLLIRTIQLIRSDKASITEKVLISTMTMYVGLEVALQIFLACSIPYLPKFGYYFFVYKSVIESGEMLELFLQNFCTSHLSYIIAALV